MVANILPTDTPLTQGTGSKGQTIYFSESSHVAYQIKADEAGSNMVAYGVGSKGHFVFFSKSGQLHIKLKWKKCRPTCKVTL